MFKSILLASVLLITSMTYASAESEGGKYSIKTMTPAVQKALNERKERFKELHSFKESGVVGENNRGYVELLQNDANAKDVVEAENHDRSVIYKTIAQQNGLEDELSTIESTFGTIKRERAKAGEMVQTSDGRWVTK